jgi:hypothetical protein
MSSLASMDLLNRDALSEGITILPHFTDLFTKSFWEENISDRFYTSLNYVLPIIVILLFYTFVLALYILPNALKYGEIRVSTVGLLAFFSITLMIGKFGKKMNLFLPLRGSKLVTLQNEIFLREDGIYDNYLNEWRWNLWLFFLTLTSFTAPFMLTALVLSFVIYKLHNYSESRMRRGIIQI